MQFLLVPDALKDVAGICAEFLTARGYSVSDTADDLSYPLSPSMSGQRGSTLVIVEVADHLDSARIDKWVIYAKGSGSQTKISICVDSACAEMDRILAYAAPNGVGVYAVADGTAREIVEPRDLSAITVVPDLSGEEAWVRARLGPAVEEYERGNWQDGLRNATRGYEELCRERLHQLVAQGAHFAPVPGSPKAPTKRQIERATLGRIRTFFSMIDPSTAETSTTLQVIDVIRNPRNDIAHKNDTPQHRTRAMKLLYVILRGSRELKL